MDLNKDTALNIIFAAIDEINSTLEDTKKLEKSADAIIFGPGGRIDSLGLVNLVMSCEQLFYEMAGQEVLLASEAAMSRRNSPYLCADTLADYAVEIVAAGNKDA